MIGREELLIWMLDLPYGAGISVDDGGLTLVSDEGDACIDVGGTPREDEEEPASFTKQRISREFDQLVLGMRSSLAELEEVNREAFERCDDLREWLRQFPTSSFKGA